MAHTGLRDTGKTIIDYFTGISGALGFLKLSNGSESDGELARLSIDVLSERERFQLWAANLGLFVVGDRSLDYRMRDNLTVKAYTGKLLDELEEDLLTIFELLSGDAVVRKDERQDEEQIELEVYHIGGTVPGKERKQDVGDPEDENLEEYEDVEAQPARPGETDAPEYSNLEAARAEFDDVVDIIDRLYHLAAKLRSSATRNPPSARNFYRDSYLDSDGNGPVLDHEERIELRRKAKEQTERFYYRRIKEIVRQALRDEAGKSYPEETERIKLGPHHEELTGDEAGSFRLEAKIKLNSHAKAVIRRIAIGTAYRQQQFIFWRQREWDRRNGVARQEVQEAKDISGLQASKVLADARAAKEIGEQGLEIPTNAKVAFSEVPSQTWKMPNEKNMLSLDETRSQSSKTEQTATPTVYEPGGRKVGWPKFPKELDGRKDFICPYCFVTCPPKYRRKEHWRSHLIQDLQPYTCTAPACPEGDNKPLNTWEEWLVHEQIYHRMEYTCSDHPSQSFPSRNQYIDHIANAHSDRKDELLISLEIDKHARVSPKPTNGCPLCSYTADNWPDMDKHLGFHLETLGLLGLPLATGLEKNEEEMASLQLEVPDNSEREISQNDATEDEPEEAVLEQNGTRMPPAPAPVQRAQPAPLEPAPTAAMAPRPARRRFFGLHVFYDPQSNGLGPAELDLVFVHGLNGHYVDTWKNEFTGTIWPRDLMPEKQPHARVLSFSYSADIYNNPSVGYIRDHARVLLARLTDQRSAKGSRGQPEVPLSRPIVFVAHSLGGLIVKQLIRFAHCEEQYKPIAKDTRGIVFFSTPHHGADTEKWLSIAEAFAPLAPPVPGDQTAHSPLVDVLKRDSNEVCNIGEDFRFLARGYAIVSFYELQVWPGTTARIVEKSSALLGLDHEDQVGLEACHTEMCRFEDLDDPLFEVVAERIKRAADGVSASPEVNINGEFANGKMAMKWETTQAK